MTDTDFEFEQDQPEFKSKTQLKNEMLALQKLGRTLVELSDGALAKIPLDEELGDAIFLARRINRKKDGYRRQLQFIGKLMRSRDTAPIEEALAELTASHAKENRAFHKFEQLRDELVANGDEAIQALLNSHPQLERQKLRQLVRTAQKEQQQQKTPKAAREIFRYLRDTIDPGAA